ncbi:MAG: hypothetical protein SGPRY_008280, partial [Prymnesium sp.]
PACASAIPQDLAYEDCAPWCAKASCRACACKFCLGCGGPPARAGPRAGCEGSLSLSFDLDGRLELTMSKWRRDTFVSLQPTAGLSIVSLLPSEHYTLEPSSTDRIASVRLTNTRSATDHSGPLRMIFTYSGDGPFLEPASEARNNASLALNSARCPRQDFPEGCTSNIPLLPEGGARFEAVFSQRDPAGSRWESSLAQNFQTEAAKQISVRFRPIESNSQGAVFGPTALFSRIAEPGSRASTSHDGVNHCALSELLIVLHILERYAEGRYLTFDLLPLELNIEPLIRRLLVALRDSPNLHVSELRRVLARGRTERVWAASSDDDGQSTSDRPLALALVVLLPALICTCLGLSARKQREAASAAVARDMPPMHRGFSIPSCARVRYALNGGEDSTEVTLSLTKIHSVKELESTIVQGMPREVPHNAELLIAFEDSSGEQRQLNSPSTCLQEALLASSFDVSCTRTRRNGQAAHATTTKSDQTRAHVVNEGH